MEVKFKGRLERGRPVSVRILNRIMPVTEDGWSRTTDKQRL
jgi:hypothetical protein